MQSPHSASPDAIWPGIQRDTQSHCEFERRNYEGTLRPSACGALPIERKPESVPFPGHSTYVQCAVCHPSLTGPAGRLASAALTASGEENRDDCGNAPPRQKRIESGRPGGKREESEAGGRGVTFRETDCEER